MWSCCWLCSCYLSSCSFDFFFVGHEGTLIDLYLWPNKSSYLGFFSLLWSLCPTFGAHAWLIRPSKWHKLTVCTLLFYCLYHAMPLPLYMCYGGLMHVFRHPNSRHILMSPIWFLHAILLYDLCNFKLICPCFINLAYLCSICSISVRIYVQPYDSMHEPARLILCQQIGRG